MPSALIIDDHVVVRHGLKQMLREEFRGIAFGDAGNAVEARLALAKRPWDLVVLDIGMPGQDGFEVLREIRRNHPQMKVLVLSVHLERQYAAQSLELGAAGYVSKDASRSELLKAFRTVLAGKRYLSRSISGELTPKASDSGDPPHKALSAREVVVMRALAMGKRSGEIAAQLNLDIRTVSTYKRRILNKLQLNSIADLVRYFIDHDLS